MLYCGININDSTFPCEMYGFTTLIKRFIGGPVSKMSVPCSPEVTCWERADLLNILYGMFIVCSVAFLCGVLGQV